MTTAALLAQKSTQEPGNLGTVTYVQNGTLCICHLPDGAPRALAAGKELSAPRFSPSGRWIVFREGDNILRLVSADGSRSKAWSAVERQIEWLPGRDLLLIDPTNALSEENDWNAPVITYADPVGTLSRDGRHHAWVSEKEGEKKRLFIAPFNAQGSPRLIAETSGEDGGFEIFTFVRGGSRILYWTTNEDGANVWSYGMDIQMGGGPQPVNTSVCTLVADTWGKMVALSPAADMLAAAVGSDKLMYQDHRLVLADISGDAKSPIVQVTGPSVHVLNPAWSPNGQTLAWSQGPDATVLGERLMRNDEHLTWEKVWLRSLRERRIWSAGNGGRAQPLQLTNDPQYSDSNPIWSRDGRYILFLRSAFEDDWQDTNSLWLMRADGSAAHEIAGPVTSPLPDHRDFDWSFAATEF